MCKSKADEGIRRQEVLANNKTWKAVQEYASWAARISQLETLVVTVVLPIVECVFINLWTGAAPGQGTPFGAAIIALAVVHAVLVVLIIVRQNTNPVQIATSVLELQEK